MRVITAAAMAQMMLMTLPMTGMRPQMVPMKDTITALRTMAMALASGLLVCRLMNLQSSKKYHT